MVTKATARKQIEKVLASATDAVSLSDKLFTPDGLFSHLAKTKTERAKLVRSALFRKAQKRFRELQYKEAREIFGNLKRRLPVAILPGKKTRKIG